MKVKSTEINRYTKIRDRNLGHRDQFQIMKNRERRERLDGEYL